MLKFLPAIGPRKYDNEKKQVTTLGPNLFWPFILISRLTLVVLIFYSAWKLNYFDILLILDFFLCDQLLFFPLPFSSCQI